MKLFKRVPFCQVAFSTVTLNTYFAQLVLGFFLSVSGISFAQQAAPPAASAPTTDDEMSKAILEKLQKSGDIVIRPSDLPPKPPQKAAVAANPVAKQEAKPAAKPIEHAHWSYTEGPDGPANWWRTSKDNLLCSAGKQQSPINIEGGILVDLPPLRFDYKISPLTIQDNGHTILVNYAEGSNLSLDARQYRLVQFHFHKPSEEAIDGKRADMVAHLVHQHHDGRLLVVAVLMNSSLEASQAENAAFQMILNHIPLVKKESSSPNGVMIDLNQLLPKNLAYFTFMGSLTTPPCSENVQWVVLKEAALISKQQLDNFSRIYPNNARPLQSRSGRLIKEAR
jgi:carbonic anhydrase